jgi:hypothetical protein
MVRLLEVVMIYISAIHVIHLMVLTQIWVILIMFQILVIHKLFWLVVITLLLLNMKFTEI